MVECCDRGQRREERVRQTKKESGEKAMEGKWFERLLKIPLVIVTDVEIIIIRIYLATNTCGQMR